MASKSRKRPLTKLKQSFVVTFSAVAAGTAGCGYVTSDDGPEASVNPPGFWGPGGIGGVGGVSGVGGTAGVGGVGGEAGAAGFTSNPPACPGALPTAGEACEPTWSENCEYATGGQLCGGQPEIAVVTCEQNVWVVRVPELACNPPPPDIDSGIEDEDAGG